MDALARPSFNPTTVAQPVVSATSGLPWDSILAQKPQADRWAACISTLLSYLSLGDDWNGDGAAAPTPANVYGAVAWLQQLQECGSSCPPPQAVPGVNGEVLLVWQDRSFYLEAEINTPYQVEWMLTSPGQAPKHWVTPGAWPPPGGPGEPVATTVATLPPTAPSRYRVISGATLPAIPTAA